MFKGHCNSARVWSASKRMFSFTRTLNQQPTGILMAGCVLKFLRSVFEPSSPDCSQSGVHIRFFSTRHLPCSRLRIKAALFPLSIVLVT